MRVVTKGEEIKYMPENHEPFIRQTYLLARQAAQKGNHPFGALLVRAGEIILTAENSVNSDRDITRHAELNLVSQASRQFDSDSLSQCSLYTSTEPCAMCAGSIYWAGIRLVVYGCSAAALGRLTGGDLVVPCRQIFGHGKRPTQVIGPILEPEGIEIHRQFWR
jgi:tRNA(Arg) A34 adenosine deaminase TadA